VARVALIADVHVANFKRFGGQMQNGLNDRARLTLQTIQAAGKICRHERVDALVVLGDLFDHPHPSPSLVRATAEALLSCSNQVIVVLGNHDMQSDGEWDHACSSMGLHHEIQVVANPAVVTVTQSALAYGVQLLLCPYRPGLASEWLPASLAQLHMGGKYQGKRVLCTHLGIWDDATPAYLKAAKDAVGIGQMRWLCDAHSIDAVFAGNWHGFRLWGGRGDSRLVGAAGAVDVCIPGALCPQGFQEADQSKVGSLVVIDTERSASGAGLITRHTVPGPRWLSLDCDAQGVSPSKISGVTHQFVRLQCRREHVDAALESQRKFSESPDHTCVVQVVGAEDEQMARDAAAKAKAAASPELAMEAFASFANVEEPGTREGVLQRLAQYRKAAAE
jgi:Calcineurin-like phosphoesterase